VESESRMTRGFYTPSHNQNIRMSSPGNHDSNTNGTMPPNDQPNDLPSHNRNLVGDGTNQDPPVQIVNDTNPPLEVGHNHQEHEFPGPIDQCPVNQVPLGTPIFILPGGPTH